MAPPWRRREYNRHWQTLTLGTKLFYFCFALLVTVVPTPESATAITSHLTPSQFSISPFLTSACHLPLLLPLPRPQLQQEVFSL